MPTPSSDERLALELHATLSEMRRTLSLLQARLVDRPLFSNYQRDMVAGVGIADERALGALDDTYTRVARSLSPTEVAALEKEARDALQRRLANRDYMARLRETRRAQSA